eukprot:1835103-Rhodomonas_salina.1
MVKLGKVGRIGGPYEFNLRDLVKMKDVLSGNAKDQKFHYQQTFGAVDGMHTPKCEVNEAVNLLLLRKVADLVYARPFHSLMDQDQVRQEIEKVFPLSPALAALEAAGNIDESLAGSVRIGSIYMKRGKAGGKASPLEHTPSTVQQLQMLAAAAQSRRAVLLEGDTCSRKTALVRELARLTKHDLVIIPMHEDIDTADLIGQWLPVVSEDGSASLRAKTCELVRDAMSTFVLHCAALENDEGWAVMEARQEIGIVYTHFNTATSGNSEDPAVVPEDLRMLKMLKKVLEVMAERSNLKNESAFAFSQLRLRGEKLEELLRCAMAKGTEGMAFTFVESELVWAVRHGAWVLLDGINSAPSEVVERLNSLLEERPMLNLYEHSDGEVLSFQNKKIHPDFGIFATSNICRKQASKLSAAVLNRMIRIWLPRMDAELEPASRDWTEAPDVRATDLFQLLKYKMGGVLAGEELVTVLLRFHQTLVQMQSVKRIDFVSGFSLSFRNIQQTIESLRYRLQQESSPVSAVVWAVQHNYAEAAHGAKDRDSIKAALAAELTRADILSAPFSRLPLSQQREATWEVDAVRLELLMASLESTLCSLLASVIHAASHRQKHPHPAAFPFIRTIFQSILPRLYAREACIIEMLPAWDGFDSSDVQSRELVLLACMRAMAQLMSSEKLRVVPVSKWELIVAELERLCNDLVDTIFVFLERASYQDVHQRSVELKNVQSVLATFLAALSFRGQLTTRRVIQNKAQKLLFEGKSFISMITSTVAAVTLWTAPFSDSTVIDLRAKFDASLDEQKDRAAKCAFNMFLQRPIVDSWSSMNSMVRSVLVAGAGSMESLMPLCVTLQWQGLQWQLRIKDSPRVLLVPTRCTSQLAVDHIMHLDELF